MQTAQLDACSKIIFSESLEQQGWGMPVGSSAVHAQEVGAGGDKGHARKGAADLAGCSAAQRHLDV